MPDTGMSRYFSQAFCRAATTSGSRSSIARVEEKSRIFDPEDQVTLIKGK
jgi:hypothetical protein